MNSIDEALDEKAVAAVKAKMRKLEITFVLTDSVENGEKKMGHWYVGVYLDERAITGDEENDKETIEAMTMPMLELVWKALGIESPLERSIREDKELIEKLKESP